MEIQQTYGESVRFIGVPGSTDLSSLTDFVEGTGSVDITHVVDPDRELWQRFEVQRRHTYVLITPDGTIERIDFRDLSERIATLT